MMIRFTRITGISTYRAENGHAGHNGERGGAVGRLWKQLCGDGGNQAYQQYLSQLNGVIPELAQLAYERYQDEVAGKRNNLNVLQGLEDTAYGRYRDTVSDWNTERDYLAGRYDTEYSRDYGAYRDSVSDWESDRSYNYQKEQDALAQKNWEKEYALSQAQLARVKKRRKRFIKQNVEHILRQAN